MQPINAIKNTVTQKILVYVDRAVAALLNPWAELCIANLRKRLQKDAPPAIPDTFLLVL